MKSTPYITLIVSVVFLSIVLNFENGMKLLSQQLSQPMVYVTADTLSAPESQWEILGGTTSDGKPMMFHEALRLVEQKGSYTPIAVSPDWTPPTPEK
jgi:hypothetical protein